MFGIFSRFLILLYCLGCYNVFAQGAACSYSLEKFDFHYRWRPNDVGVAIIGDSIVRGANWGDLLRRTDVVNLGISGDNIHCIKNRLVYALDMHPKVIVIEGGINDFPSKSLDYIYDNYVQIVNLIKRNNVVPILISLTYLGEDVGANYGDKKNYIGINSSINELNRRIYYYAVSHNIEYVDVNSMLRAGLVLNSKYTIDGLHLNAAGYFVFASALLEAIERTGF